MTPKIATCCYCGTRAALTLKGRERHELACASCGAPLHELKGLKPPAERQGPVETVKPVPLAGRDWLAAAERKAAGKRKKKRRKPLSRRLLSEAFDVIEDIFD